MTVVAKQFDKARALVVGGTSGIGIAAAAALVRAGVRSIVVNGRNEKRGAAAAQHLRSLSPAVQAEFIAADVTRPDGASFVVDCTVDLLGSLDIVVNCAGGDHAPELLHQIGIGDVQKILDHYILGPVHVSRCALPHMMASKGGVILNVASDAGRVPTPGATLNGAAMAAIIMFSRSLALEAKRSGVRVHAITPSIVKNTLTFDRVMVGGFSAKLFGKAMKRASLGVVTPDDIAPIIVFLASPAAARMTGQVISVNGGISVPI